MYDPCERTINKIVGLMSLSNLHYVHEHPYTIKLLMHLEICHMMNRANELHTIGFSIVLQGSVFVL